MDTLQVVTEPTNLTALHTALVAAGIFVTIGLGMTVVGLRKGGNKARSGGRKDRGHQTGDSGEEKDSGLK